MADRITADDLKERLDRRQPVLFLDVRDASEIAATGTIESAVCIPMKQLESRLAELPRSTFLVTA